MKAKVARLCSVAALFVGMAMIGGNAECVFNVDEDDGIFDKAAVVEQQ